MSAANVDMTTTQRNARAIGRPLKFETPQALATAIDGYFQRAEQGKKLSVMGLCVHLDCGRQTLLDYQGVAAFSDVVSRAKARIQAYYEEHGQDYKSCSATFADRMLTRTGWACVEQSARLTAVASIGELAALLGAAGDDLDMLDAESA